MGIRPPHAGGGVFAFMDAQRTGWSARQRRSLEDQNYLGVADTDDGLLRQSNATRGTELQRIGKQRAPICGRWIRGCRAKVERG